MGTVNQSVFSDAKPRHLLRSVEKSSDRFGLVGSSLAMANIRDSIAKAAMTNITVMILGEPGTGKELTASAIHGQSRRGSGPFVPISCPALVDTLVEAELFGARAGSYTGSSRFDSKGKLAEGDGGTIFLDEVGELSKEAQKKLLRVMQERKVYPVGSAAGKDINIRILAATNMDLERAVLMDVFRGDLFDRLNVYVIEMPPLRERMADVPELMWHFSDRFLAKEGVPLRLQLIEMEVLNMLMSQQLYGNVRELENCIERSLANAVADGDARVADSGGMILKRNHVSGFRFRGSQWRTGSLECKTDLPLTEVPLGGATLTMSHHVAELEKRLITMALDKTRGNKRGAARELGVSDHTLQSKIKKYGITEKYSVYAATVG